MSLHKTINILILYCFLIFTKWNAFVENFQCRCEGEFFLQIWQKSLFLLSYSSFLSHFHPKLHTIIVEDVSLADDDRYWRQFNGCRRWLRDDHVPLPFVRYFSATQKERMQWREGSSVECFLKRLLGWFAPTAKEAYEAPPSCVLSWPPVFSTLSLSLSLFTFSGFVAFLFLCFI